MQRLIRDTVAAGGRHAETEEVHAAEEVHAEGCQAERGASEGARAHGGGLGRLSGADHQMPAGVGVGSRGEAAISVLLEPVQPLPVVSCYSPAALVRCSWRSASRPSIIVIGRVGHPVP